jgi:hypothetical protein
MVSTNNKDLYELMRLKRSHGMAREASPDYFEKYKKEYPDLPPSFLFVTDGYNLRNHEIPAVLATSQLKRLDKMIEIRKQNYRKFIDIISSYPDKFFIHFDSFSLMKPQETSTDATKKENQRIYHKFSHGITMYPSLMYMSVNDRHRPADLSTDRRLGHISQYQHMEIFMHIKKIMDENLYANDKVYIYCDDFNEDEVKIGCDEC